jgi:hypothetical protein
MTTKELATAGISLTFDHVPPIVEEPSTEVPQTSKDREEGEIGSGNDSYGREDLSNVDANLDELVALKSSYPPTLVFGKSLVTP